MKGHFSAPACPRRTRARGGGSRPRCPRGAGAPEYSVIDKFTNASTDCLCNEQTQVYDTSGCPQMDSFVTMTRNYAVAEKPRDALHRCGIYKTVPNGVGNQCGIWRTRLGRQVVENYFGVYFMRGNSRSTGCGGNWRSYGRQV